MQISFYSLLMAAVWSGAFIILVCVLRMSKAGMLYYNAASLFVILLGCTFRCLFPLDFPGFTQPISSTSVYARIDTFLLTPVYRIGLSGPMFSPMEVFCVIWAVGAIIGLLVIIIRHRRMTWTANRYDLVDEGLAYDIANSFCEEYHIPCFRVSTSPSVLIPFVYGFRYPRVILPAIKLSEKNLRFIITHELMHWKNKDMWVRLFTLLICCLFWWNPFVYLLLWNMEQTLEIKCDVEVIKKLGLDEKNRNGYLNILEEMTKRAHENRRKSSFLSSEFTNYTQLKNIRERLTTIKNYVPDKKRERRVTIFTAAIMTILLIFSYRYIIQPYFYVPDQDYSAVMLTGDGTGQAKGNGDEVTTSNGYLVLNSDGTYSVYINGEYFNSIDEITAKQFIEDGFEVRSSTEKEETS